MIIMLDYLFLSEENGRVRYAYYPMGDHSAEGIIVFLPDGGMEIEKLSPLDIQNMYAGMAFHHIDRNKKEGIVAWC